MKVKILNVDKILNNITSIIETYESGVFKDLHIMHRELTSNMYYLTNEQVKARSKWLEVYYNCKSTVNAVKEREADKQVPELYMCRKIYEAAKGVAISMSLEIKLN
jgi:hypothetical protein